MVRSPRSPYELTSGSALDDLHPVLRTYFGAIPAGMRGHGSGVFDVVGTPRLWLRPALALLARQGILFPVWEQNVPFTVVNGPLVDRDGRTAVVAVRHFHFLGGARTMVDAITAENPGADGLVDHLGLDRRFRVRLSTTVVRGELHLVSTSLELRIGRQHYAVPSALAPRVTLVERFDDAARGGEGAQRVSVTVDAPLIGRIYEYTGTFTYELRAEVETRVDDEVADDGAAGSGFAVETAETSEGAETAEAAEDVDDAEDVEDADAGPR
ncbi:DUF4166 domain-containing protein [Herbiconiux sp. CPCC 205763]|uniref:DUF4166 domain-containing protein n=1 Tax=Herbiconiux aconitum TaxID=2970913 RepID=A0ABT2GTI1_9MICO|nr:DUF4166 domain-containing protein [Herbiconiux aconitum]MCS5719463.1 DUF4166 domain-containing protein [Herbiconiux aconitum]